MTKLHVRRAAFATREGVGGTVRLVAVMACAVLVALALQRLPTPPMAMDSDAWNYLAAGERLNAGHSLYALSAGDRPVTLVSPYWSVPLLAPPPIALVWRPLALLGEQAMLLWVAGAVMATIAMAVWILARGSRLAVLGLIALSPFLAMTALAGNANAYLAPLLALAWIRRERSWLPSVAVIAATVVKLTPILLLRWPPPRQTALVAMGVLVAPLIVAPGAWEAWWRSVPGSEPSPMSIAGLTGLSPTVVGAAGLVAGFIAGVGRSDRALFVIGLLVAVAITPAFYFTTLALLAPLLVIDR